MEAGGGGGIEKNIFCTHCAAQFPMLTLKSLHFQHFFPSPRVVTHLMALVILTLPGVSNWV